jgi:hypothetical protein
MLLTLLTFTITRLKQFQFFNKILHVDESSSLCSLPPEWHVKLTLEKKIRKILFVGDVHGCHDELDELLEKAGVYESDDIIVIFVGDVCNKGPKSIETVRLIRQLGSMAYSVRGNHEQAVLYRLKQFDQMAKLPKNYSWITELSPEERLFLERLPFTILIPLLNVIVVHAGLVPGVKLPDQKPRSMINMRNYVHEKLSGSKNIDDGLRWGSQWPGPQFVIFGHDARRLLQKYRHAIGLDTGCLYGLKLTGYMLNVDDENPLQNGKFISVDAHSAYARPARG